MAKIKAKSFMIFCCILALVWLITYSLSLGLHTYIYIRNGDELAHSTTRYQQVGHSGQRILILGDSLAYGVGSSVPQESFAGQIGQRYPTATIENKAVIGEDTTSLSANINNYITRKYDQIYIIVGGNDISHYRVKMAQSKLNLEHIYKIASQNSKKVYVYTTINFDRVAASPGPITSYYSNRSEELRESAKKIAATFGNVRYVDVYNTEKRQYKNFQAKDGFHLNDKGVAALVYQTFAK